MSDTTPAAAPAPAAPAQSGTLDDLMLAMDVVDTLRHDETLVLRELDESRREEELMERLRSIYRGQGIDVPDRILREGVKGLKESRFVYTPPPPSTAVTLARLWVRRGRVGVALVVLVAVAVGGWIAYDRSVNAPVREARETFATARMVMASEARSPEAKQKLEDLIVTGETALRRGDAVSVRAAVNAIEALQADLLRTYDLMVVSRPGEPSGLSRIPDRNPNARNYYLIVEAIGPNGQPLSLPVVSEEDGKRTTVSKWGVRVSQPVYDAVVRDKQDDGIIQNRRLGSKRRGSIAVEWAVPMPSGTGGAITSW